MNHRGHREEQNIRDENAQKAQNSQGILINLMDSFLCFLCLFVAY